MNHSKNNRIRFSCVLLAILALDFDVCRAEEVGHRWGTEERERKYYPIVNVPLPKDTVVEVEPFRFCQTTGWRSEPDMVRFI